MENQRKNEEDSVNPVASKAFMVAFKGPSQPKPADGGDRPSGLSTLSVASVQDGACEGGDLPSGSLTPAVAWNHRLTNYSHTTKHQFHYPPLFQTPTTTLSHF